MDANIPNASRNRKGPRLPTSLTACRARAADRTSRVGLAVSAKRREAGSPHRSDSVMPALRAHSRIAGAVCILITAITVLTGCDTKTPENAGTRELKLGYVMKPIGAVHEGAKKFAELVETKTGGVLRIKIYDSGKLGKDRELAEGLTFGSVDLVLSGLASVASYIPEYEVLEAPFVFRDYEHLDHVVNGPIGKQAEVALVKAKGIRILDWWPRGPRYLTANKKITQPADLKGMKLRVPELPTYIEAWRILGANTTPITYTEIWTALKQGIVEGQENPLEVIYTDSFHEVQKYCMETQHLLGTYMLMASEALLKTIPPDQRKAIEEAAEEAGTYQTKLMHEFEADYVKKLKEEGMEFVPVDKQAFREPVLKELPKRFEGRWGKGLFARIQETK